MSHSHLPGRPILARCLLNFSSPFRPRLCMIPGQIKSFHLLFNTIAPCPPWMSVPSLPSLYNVVPCPPWMSVPSLASLYNVNPVSISLTFHVSRPSQSTFLNHQTDWFQSQQFSQFCVLLPFVWGKTTHPSHHAHFSSNWLYFIFISQVSLPYIKQLVTHNVNVLMKILSQLVQANTLRTFIIITENKNTNGPLLTLYCHVQPIKMSHFRLIPRFKIPPRNMFFTKLICRLKSQAHSDFWQRNDSTNNSGRC